jgi:hypothetical protein
VTQQATVNSVRMIPLLSPVRRERLWITVQKLGRTAQRVQQRTVTAREDPTSEAHQYSFRWHNEQRVLLPFRGRIPQRAQNRLGTLGVSVFLLGILI